MRKTKEILRLVLNEGLTQRQIAESTGAGRTAIQGILVNAKAAGLDWDQLQDLTEAEILARLRLQHKEQGWGLLS